MESNRGYSESGLRQDAMAIFRHALSAADARKAVAGAVALVDERHLAIDGQTFALATGGRVHAVAFGKAAHAMAAGLNVKLEKMIGRGLIATGTATRPPSPAWQTVVAGHPLPDAGSLEAGRAAAALLRAADPKRDLVIFLVSGGGSSMLEIPVSGSISLDDLRETNRVLVGCGAPIGDVNIIRRALSASKGGGLARIAGATRQVTLIVSDTNAGDERSVASGATLAGRESENHPTPFETARRWNILDRLPRSVAAFLERPVVPDKPPPQGFVRTLLDNRTALGAAADEARRRGFVVMIADDLVENPVAEGARELAARLEKLRRERPEAPAALISGGEFACPVRGTGRGGRSLETVLRVLVGLEERRFDGQFAILGAGTDGIDGNAPAAGALADEGSLARAFRLGLDPSALLANSDSFAFFDALGDAIVTGPTGTNVRDVRVLLSR